MNGIEFRAWRMSREWSQDSAATALGVSRRTIVTMENAGAAEIPKLYALAVRGVNASGDTYPIKKKPGGGRKKADTRAIDAAIAKALEH